MKNNIVIASFIGVILVITNLNAQNKVAKRTPQNYEEALKSASPIEDKTKNGVVNWSEQFIEAKGQSAIDTVRFKNKAQAKMMAIRGAVVVAQRNLLEIIKGVQITGETTVEDMITTNDKITTKIDGVIKGAVQVGDAVIKDGFAEVTMKVSMYSTNGLAPTVLEPAQTLINTNSSKRTSIDSSANGTTNTIMSTEKEVVFNMGGKKFDPSMFPVIVDENGKMVFDFTKIYDLKTGKFPKYLQVGKEVLKNAGFKKGVDIIDIVQNGKGELVISETMKKKVNWEKFKKTAGKIAKLALLFI